MVRWLLKMWDDSKKNLPYFQNGNKASTLKTKKQKMKKMNHST
ncbi:hypothetical protein P278_23930 [Zhouia amylolytica AD3]|uniref:Uncharacterized protein n=1 Tax=Zhouia amylolytica AD3 TaxID=1286632 RepID=W2UJV4_9FLAO|nr:hypothetical protein P278_23930 [Zhouia amylolytica AD3]